MKKGDTTQFEGIFKTMIVEMQHMPDLTIASIQSLVQATILQKLLPCMQSNSMSISTVVKDLLTDADVSSPHKYLPLLYVSLLQNAQSASQLSKFYYQLTSHAIREYKQGNSSFALWTQVFDRIYQYGMLLLIGSRSLIICMGSFSPRVNSTLIAQKAQQRKLSRLVKIYNCLLCVPQQYLSLKQVLYFTLIFTRWQSKREQFRSFFVQFTQRTQNKLLRKLRSYPVSQFNQQHVLNLIKLILGGDQLIFSYFLQIKYAYQASKMEDKKNQSGYRQAIRVFRQYAVSRSNRHFFNFVVQLLLKTDQSPLLKEYQRQAILFVCMRYIMPKYSDNQSLFAILIRYLLRQPNALIAQVGFRFIRQQAMQHLTVNKLKLLLNLLNSQNWQRGIRQSKTAQIAIQDREISRSKVTQTVILSRLGQLVSLLTGLSRRYSQTSLTIYSQSGGGVQIKNVKNVQTVVVVVCFDGVGRLGETSNNQMRLLRFTLNKEEFQVCVQFADNIQIQNLQYSEALERKANIIIRRQNIELVNEKVQYLRSDGSPFETLLVCSLAKDPAKLTVCIDGALFVYDIAKKAQFSQIVLADMDGSLRAFYALKNSQDPIFFHKKWCQSHRKTKFVVESQGQQNLSYHLSKKQTNVIVDTSSSSTFSLFQSKSTITIRGQVLKHPTFVDLLVQLGGLKTIFFLLQKFSRNLLSLRGKEEQVTSLLVSFFAFLRTAALLDQTASFLSQLQGCFEYLNAFLFLLIKRNKAVRDSGSSGLLLGIFQLLGYFRGINRQLAQTQQTKIFLIEKTLVESILANFEIWSNCSAALQLFVLAEIECFIKQQKYWLTFVKDDLLSSLLTALVLFQTSEGHLPHAPHIHFKIIQLCCLLYNNRRQLVFTNNQSKTITEKTSINFDSFAQRDISTCVALIVALAKNKVRLSASQANALRSIVKFIHCIFVHSKYLFQHLGRLWPSILGMLCDLAKRVHSEDKELMWEIGQLVIGVIRQDNTLEYCILQLMGAVIDNKNEAFPDCFWLLLKIVGAMGVETIRKRLIAGQILRFMSAKVYQTTHTKQQLLRFCQIVVEIKDQTLYVLSTFNQFSLLLDSIKQKYFSNLQNSNKTKFMSETTQINQPNGHSKQVQSILYSSKNNIKQLPGREQIHLNNQTNQISQISQISQTNQTNCFNFKTDKWMLIHETMFQKLYKQKKITNLNKDFVSLLIINHYQFSAKNHLAVASTQQLSLSLSSIREIAQNSNLSHQQTFYSQLPSDSAFALIQHCSSWPVLYFLMSNGLLTLQNDVNIGSRPDQTNKNNIGGTIAYYLTKASSPVEMYALMMRLSANFNNKTSIISTQAPIVLFQHAVKYFYQHHNQKNQVQTAELLPNTVILITVLKQLNKCLNTVFVGKAALVTKDIDKILGSSSNNWKQKRIPNIVQNIYKAGSKIHSVLEDSRIDKDMLGFAQMIMNRVKAISQKNTVQDLCNILMTISGQINRNWETYQLLFKKLSSIALRFLQMVREYYLCIHSQTVFDTKPQGASTTLAEIIPKNVQNSQTFTEKLQVHFDSLLSACLRRGQQSQQVWRNLLISNEHWFQLQQDVDDVSTKFYQLDEKETGPYGLYKLNIRPVKMDHQQLPFPRRKELMQALNQQQQARQKQNSHTQNRMTLELSNSNLYSTLYESRQKMPSNSQNNSEMLSNSQISSQLPQMSSRSSGQFFCQYVTKRGVYAGVLKVQNNRLLYRFLGYQKLPSDEQYQGSTNKAHRIQYLSEWQSQELMPLTIPLPNCTVFSRRYILRHTAMQVFQPVKHRSYFFNLFFKTQLQRLLYQLKSTNTRVIDKRVDQFQRERLTQKWTKGQISNFQYICLVNRFSGRSYNDLSQYPVFPWVITNYTGEDGFRQLDKQFYQNSKNMRDLTLPTGKLNNEKFSKLKFRLGQVDVADKQIRFLYGSMYSNPTVLYNFFIRLQPFTRLHWQHQGRKIDHADRLFSSVADQFQTVLTSSADMKELCPEFYYWPQFLRNRNKIDLGKRQRGKQVDSVQLPPWSRSPQQFTFKMRQALQSPYISQKLPEWIDLIFGYKAPLAVAEQYDNLYHFQTYEHDLFKQYKTQAQRHVAQITISEFGQIPQQLFTSKHPQRFPRGETCFDNAVAIHKGTAKGLQVSQYGLGLLIWTGEKIIFKRAAISGFFHSYELTRQFQVTHNTCALINLLRLKMLVLQGSTLKVFERGKIKSEMQVQAKRIQVVGNYVFYGAGSKINILMVAGQDDHFQQHSVLYGHRDEIILIKTDPVMDLVVSVDRSGFVVVHELTDLRFLRAFQLNTDFQGKDGDKLKICLHQMGYFIFFDHRQTLYIFNYMGERILEQDFQIHEDEIITDIQLYSQEHSIILMSTSKGKIYSVNFLQVIRFRDTFPFKAFTRLTRNILLKLKPKFPQDFSIRQFSIMRGCGQISVVYQLIVLYENGDVVCYNEQNGRAAQIQRTAQGAWLHLIPNILPNCKNNIQQIDLFY